MASAERAAQSQAEWLTFIEAGKAEAERLAVIEAEKVEAEKVAEVQAELLRRSRLAKAEAGQLAVMEAEKRAKEGVETSKMAEQSTCPFCGAQLGGSLVVCPECNRLLSLKAPDVVIPAVVEEASNASEGDQRALARDIVRLLAAEDGTVVPAIQQYDKSYSATIGIRIRTKGVGSGLDFLLISDDGVIVRKNRREMIKWFEAQLRRQRS